MKAKLMLALSLFFQIFTSVISAEIVNVAIDRTTTIQIDPSDSFEGVIQYISQHVDQARLQKLIDNNEPCLESEAFHESPKSFSIDVLMASNRITARVSSNTSNAPRDYYGPLSDQAQKDIGFIVKTLANESLIKIAFTKSTLEQTGDRVDAIHPLKFFLYVFSTEELKVCMQNIQGRGWVWNEFIDGMTDSFVKEAAIGNIKPEYVADFASKLSIDQNAINPLIQAQRWKDLVTTLIKIVPRKSGGDRYNY